MATTKTYNLHSRFFGILSKMPGANKEDIVWQYSHCLTNSLSEFLEKNPKGYWAMINDLERRGVLHTPNTSNATNSTLVKSKRSAILHRLQMHGVDTTDWNKVNAFLEQPKIAGKRLYDMTIDEMQSLIPKLESILRKDKENARKLAFIVQNN